MFCPNCGTNNNEGVKFCSGCGAPMGTNNAAPVEPAPVYAPVEPQAPVYAPVEPVAPAPAPQKPKKNTGLIVGIIVGVLVIIGAVIAILFATGTFDTDSKKEETKTEETDNKKQDKEENKEEAPKGDENHDGRLIGEWIGTETAEMDGIQIAVPITHYFYEDGTYKGVIDVDEYKKGLRKVIIDMYKDYGITEEQIDVIFQESYGVTFDEYVDIMISENDISMETKGTWETNGDEIIIVDDKPDSGETDSVTKYSLSSDENTLYFTTEATDATGNTMTTTGTYNRVK